VRGALTVTPKSPVSTTTYGLPQTTGQPRSPLQVASSPATEHSVTVDLVSESMNDSESSGRIENRTDPERPLTSLTASHVQQAQSGNKRQPVEGLISAKVLTSTSLEKPQQGSQMSSALGGSDVRHNLATSSLDCMDDQTQSTRVSQEGFPTRLDERNSTSITQKGMNEESRVRPRCFVENDQIVDRSTQTSCKDSNVVSGVGEFSQLDAASFNTTCNSESNDDSYRKYPKRQTQLPSRYADFDLGQQDRKRSKNDQPTTNKSLSKMDRPHRSNYTPSEMDQTERRIYQKDFMPNLNKKKFGTKTRKIRYQRLPWSDTSVGRPSIRSVRTIGCRARPAAPAEAAKATLIGQKRGFWIPCPHARSYAPGAASADRLNMIVNVF